MKKTLLIITAVAAGLYVLISAIKGTLNPAKWFTPTLPPAEGSECTADGKKGTIKNGQCVVVDVQPPDEQRAGSILIYPSAYPSWTWFNGKKKKCYAKTPGTVCDRRMYDPMMGWGVLYSETSTSCCYLF